MDYVLIGQRICEARKAHGLSQMQLAELVDISPTHMSHIETGSTKLSLPVLASLARVLTVSADYLIYGSANTREEVNSILDSCSEKQERILVEILKGAKIALDQCSDL